MGINPENRHCAAILDTLLDNLAYKSTKKTLPVLEQIETFDLDAQLQRKFSKDPNNLDFPDLEEIGIADPNEIIFEQNYSQSVNPDTSFIGMLTRGRLRGRTSNILPSSPYSNSSVDNGSGNVRAKRGRLFQATSSDQLNPQTSSPPRLARRLFNSRDLANSSDNEEEGGREIGIDVFDEDDMDLDSRDESSS